MVSKNFFSTSGRAWNLCHLCSCHNQIVLTWIMLHCPPKIHAYPRCYKFITSEEWLLVRQAETWDPLRQHWYLDDCLLEQQSTKKLQGTDNNCVCASAEAPTLWLLDGKSQLTGKDLDAGKDSRQKEKGARDNEMVEWHHQFHGNEFAQTLGDSKRLGSLACCSLWGHKESDTTEQLNDNVLCTPGSNCR